MLTLNAHLNTGSAADIGLMEMRFTVLAVIETVCLQPPTSIYYSKGTYCNMTFTCFLSARVVINLLPLITTG